MERRASRALPIVLSRPVSEPAVLIFVYPRALPRFCNGNGRSEGEVELRLCDLPPALRMTCASPRLMPKAAAGSMRASMQVTGAKPVSGQ